MGRVYCWRVSVSDELDRIAGAAGAYAAPGELLTGVIAAEPAGRPRVFLCAFAGDRGRSWLVLDGEGRPVTARTFVREAVSIAALCEVAEESAAGGRLDELRQELVTLRLTEAPEGIEEAEDAALELERTIERPPRVVTPAYLDRIGEATQRLERVLGEAGASPFAAALQNAVGAVEELAAEVLAHYKVELR
jgi:hypothetical protein